MGQMQKTIKINVRTSQYLWPFEVMIEIQKVMEEGLAKHPKGEGWDESVGKHIAHAALHLQAITLGVKSNDTDDHLAHAFTRLMMAVAIERGYADIENEFIRRDRKTEEKIRKNAE